MFGLARSVDLVARPAAASFIQFIDVHKMKVSLFVSEVGQRFGFIFLPDLPIVSLKTHRIILFPVSNVEIRLLPPEERQALALRF